MEKIISFLKRHRFNILSLLVICAVVAISEIYAGRSLLGPDGKFGWWDNNIWSSENSQRVADAYSFSHIIHGILFYAFLWLVARRLPLRYRFVAALVIEAAWEILENSPLVINRYREATIALGYVGDSVLNSVCDVGMMALGFLIARYYKIWVSISLIIIFELGCLLWVRDNLTLNVIMLVHPVESIRVWQSEGHNNPEPIFCTQEAKQCPDGSYVGRTGPKCEFSQCRDVREETVGSIGQKIFNGGVYITPLKVVSDSRCPVDVQCIWAGEVLVKIKLEKGEVSKEVEMKEGGVVDFEGSRVSLIGVFPAKNSKVPTLEKDYQFTFQVQ